MTEPKGVDDAIVAGVKTEQVWGDDALALVEAHLNKLTKKPEEPSLPPWEPAPFPTEVLPAPLQGFLRAVSTGLPCPEDFVGLPLLAVAGAVVGGVRAVQVLEGWQELPSVYGAIIAPPASRKTPASKIVVKAPIDEIQGSLVAVHNASMASWTEKVINWKAAMVVHKALLKAHFESGKEEDPPAAPAHPGPEPHPVTLEMDDTTVEAICDNLRASPRGVLIHKDELISWKRTLNQYRGGKGGDLQYFLSFWASAGITVHRKGSKDAIRVRRPFVSLVGWIQPDLVGDLGDEDGREDGLLHRFLFAMPKTEAIPPLNLAGIPKSHVDLWKSVCLSLRSLGWAEGGDPSDPRPVILPLSPGALLAFQEWHEAHRKESLAPSFPSELEGPWGKMPAYLARLSLILRLLREGVFLSGLSTDPVGPEVSEQDVRGAWSLVDYFKGHARGVYQRMVYDRDSRRVKDLVKWVRAERGGRVTATEVYKSGRFKCRGLTDALNILGKVADKGLGRWEEDIRKKRVFVLNQEDGK